MREWYRANHDRLDELLLPHQSDGIKEIEQGTIVNRKSVNSECFDLQGRKVKPSIKKKGIYIYGNKKIQVK